MEFDAVYEVFAWTDCVSYVKWMNLKWIMVTRSCGDPLVKVIESSSKEFGRTDFLEKKCFRSLQSWFESIFTTLFSHPKNMNRILPPISIKPSTDRAYDSSAQAGKNFAWEPWFSHRFCNWTIIRYRYNKTHFKRFQKRIINIYLTSAEDKNLRLCLRI